MKNNIAKLRKERSLSQQQLGKIIGVTQATISSWEKGRTEPDSVSSNKLAKLFQVTIGYLMGFEFDRLLVPVSNAEYIELGLVKPEHFMDNDLPDIPPERDDIIGAREDLIYTEWKVRHSKKMPYELYRIQLAMQNMNDEEKKRLLQLARTAFPHSFG